LLLTKSDTEITESTAGDGHVDGKLGVTKGGEESTETSNGIRDNN
jgi:hypothetical protein